MIQISLPLFHLLPYPAHFPCCSSANRSTFHTSTLLAFPTSVCVCMCVQRSILFSRKLASASWSPSCFSKVLGAGISNRMKLQDDKVFSCKACEASFRPLPLGIPSIERDWSPVDQHPYELQPKSTVMESRIRDIVIYFLEIELGLGKRQYTFKKTMTFAIFPKPEKR